MRRDECRILVYALDIGGGAGKNIVKYGNALSESGYDVCIASGRCSSDALLTALLPSIPTRIFGTYRSIQAILPLARALREASPDVVLVVGASNMFALQAAAVLAFYRGPVVLRETNSPSGLLKSYGAMKRVLKRPVFKYAYKRADYVICLTDAMRKELENDWAMDAEKLRLIPNGVNVPVLQPQRQRESGTPVILCVARLALQKDLGTLLKAISLVNRERECRLIIAGNGSEKQHLIKLCDELGLSKVVEFMGHVDEVSALYRSASLTVLSSRFEGFPNVLIESLAQGTPIVATDCPTGPAEIIRPDNKVGFLAKVADPEDLAQKILSCLAKEFSSDDLHAVATEYSEENMLILLQTLMREVTLQWPREGAIPNR